MGSAEGSSSGGRAETATRRLAQSSSLYLREAASQPIGWYPWGEEAFREARRSRRPILLDIGAAWCHWCHVMDEGTYSDLEISRLVNEFFVPVKVDRDQNPELDRRYQRDVGVLTGSGGWPLTVFLTPDGETLMGGTYFPPRDQHGHPGLLKILREVSRIWREDPASLRENIAGIQGALQRMEAHAGSQAPRETREAAEAIVASLGQAFDAAHGGFGTAPKFPHPTAVSLLLLQAHRGPDEGAAQNALLTLQKMADGGMYDQLGGGFHRYSVDEAWHIPHFEKMTLDNAHLLRAYGEGLAYSRDPRIEEAVRGILSYVTTQLTSPQGAGFSASVDADNAPGDDGSYYTWSRSQLKSLLSPDELKVVQWRFGLDTDATMPTDPEQNVLYRFLSPAEIADSLKLEESRVVDLLRSAEARMRKAREGRPRPGVDPAVYVSINGYLIGSLALAGRLLHLDDAIAGARRAADHILKRAYVKGKGVAHRAGPGEVGGWGMLEDQASLALGLLDLAEVTQEGEYLALAQEILETTWKEFRDPATGLLQDLSLGLYEGPKVGAVGTPAFPLEDNPHLSANAVVVLALTKLSDLTEEGSHEVRARELAGAILRRVPGAGLFACGAALGALTLEVPALRVLVEGTGPGAEELYRAAVTTYHPRKIVLRDPLGPPFGLPAELVRSPPGGQGSPRARVCRGTSCLPPITDPSDLRAALSRVP